ncbi:hypothetical protein KYG33_18605 [Chryseobacterium sp. D764]|uniref:hypothetical protein n=1 Tax=Chryseobacterium sp. D764 TaxID=2856522 RepID=UPI001C5603D5|nr:hypothetical protein [Chryseobacterium sp. D764]QXU48771.1 hypothetical protein KYG33_18605 [Chryseobacterium sp. D764]
MKKILFLIIFLHSFSFLYSQGFIVKKDGNSVTEFNGYKLSFVKYKMDADTKEFYDKIANNRVKIFISFNIDWNCITCVLNYIGDGKLSVFEGNYRTDYKFNRGYYNKNGNSEFFKFYYGNREIATVMCLNGSAQSVICNNNEGRYFNYYTNLTD